MSKNKYFIIFILLVGFLIRLFPLGFPLFSADEARIAVRGETLVKKGTDELGRNFPFIFNSSEDYQLPVVSYLTSFGILVFGKNDFGARIPFVLIGTILVFLTYKFSILFFKNENLSLATLIVTVFSPALIFFSKFPNEFIIAAFLLTLLLYILFTEKVNKTFFLLVICFMLLTSKIFWFTLIPVIYFTLYINKKLIGKKLLIWLPALILNILIFIFFIKIPQGVRSLIENNFSGLFDITVKNGIERLRSQSISYWPPFIDKILFSKAHILIAAFSNWISHFQPGILFGQLDKYGDGFLNSGVFPKMASVPFLIGLVRIIKDKKNSFLFLLIYIFLFTFPLFFVYPDLKIGYIILVTPLIVLIISKGFDNLNSKLFYPLLFLITLETLINYLFISSNIKNVSNMRPAWIKQLASDIYSSSLKNKVYISDNAISNPIPFIEWYTAITIEPHYKEDLNFPYKFYEDEIMNIKTIGSSNTFIKCISEGTLSIFATDRDMDKLASIEKVTPINIYKNDLGKETLVLVKTDKCIR